MSAITPPQAEQTAVVQSAASAMSVVCLCAAWCGVCRQYESEFAMLRSKFPHVRFEWVDVEEQEELLGEVDVETFPTLLIAQEDKALFLGPLLPQIKVLERLIEASLQGTPSASALPSEAAALWQRMHAKWQ